MKPKVRSNELRIIQAAMVALSKIDERNESLLPEVEMEDLRLRISGAITDLDWMLNYSESIDDLPRDGRRYDDMPENIAHNQFVQDRILDALDDSESDD